jgi:hypothetical protein
MTVRSDVKGGGWQNHNETIAVRSDVKAGGFSDNHSEQLAK